MKAWNRKSVRNFTESLRFNVLFERQRGRIVRDFVYMFIALEKKKPKHIKPTTTNEKNIVNRLIMPNIRIAAQGSGKQIGGNKKQSGWTNGHRDSYWS